MKKIYDILAETQDDSISSYINIISKWKKSVTPHIASNTTPIKIDKNKNMHVLVHDTIWLQELNFMKDELINILTTKTDLDIKSLTFKYSPLKIKKSNYTKALLPITDGIKNEIHYISLKFKDYEFYDAYKSAMTKYFTRYTLDEFKDKKLG